MSLLCVRAWKSTHVLQIKSEKKKPGGTSERPGLKLSRWTNRETDLYVYAMTDVSTLLNKAALGDEESTEALFPLVYKELRRMASKQMRDESAFHTLQPTALVHEAWINMVDGTNRTWENRAGFLSAASTAMRHILVDHARKKMARKRGGKPERVNLDQLDLSTADAEEILLEVEDALQHLEKIHPEWAQIVTMKYYGGMTNSEVAETLNMSRSSVDRYWSGARALLYKFISAAD